MVPSGKDSAGAKSQPQLTVPPGSGRGFGRNLYCYAPDYQFILWFERSDPVTYIVVVHFLSTMALLSFYIPASRATKVDPLKAVGFE
jgi:hypothetical protein